MTNNIQLAKDFISAWEDKNSDKILIMMSESCRYHNIPMKPLEGHENIRTFIYNKGEITEKVKKKKEVDDICVDSD